MAGGRGGGARRPGRPDVRRAGGSRRCARSSASARVDARGDDGGARARALPADSRPARSQVSIRHLLEPSGDGTTHPGSRRGRPREALRPRRPAPPQAAERRAAATSSGLKDLAGSAAREPPSRRDRNPTRLRDAPMSCAPPSATVAVVGSGGPHRRRPRRVPVGGARAARGGRLRRRRRGCRRRSAIAAAAQLRPEVVLLDVQLPDIDGFRGCGADRDRTGRRSCSSRAATVASFRRRLAANPALSFIPKSELSGEALAAASLG